MNGLTCEIQSNGRGDRGTFSPPFPMPPLIFCIIFPFDLPPFIPKEQKMINKETKF